MKNEKGAIFSLGMWGGVLSLMPLLAKINTIIALIPADLLTDTKSFIIGTVGALMALYGRWRAVTKISGLW